ncbi:nhp2-like protein 1-like protein [Vairimorpha apis BRL 01]|uniref:Nhp2-like protein 1-like protein n=1 Tax=Vairimorpha apis BRL 01 TaxID=1037528 RepID=T0LAJ9_9MICR|nr:nhp2-like protein 1-like protein [Vairimorpha apis BRL 01]
MDNNEYIPVNDEKAKKVYDLVIAMEKSKNLKKGISEVTKCINKGTAKLVIIAVDAEPPEITYSLPILCEDKGIQFIHVQSKRALGKACSIERPVVACCVYVPKEHESLRIDEKIRTLVN